jgi:hypothetical protein
MRRALEGGPAEPSNAFSMTAQNYAAMSGQWERSSLSPSALCGHPLHCSATPGTAMTSPTLLERTGIGRRHARHCTSYGPPLTAPSSRPADSGRTTNLYTTTLEAAPVRAQVLTNKRCIPLRSASVRTPHLFHHGIPKVLVNPRSKWITSIRSTFTL